MSGPSPRMTIAKQARANGILSVPAATATSTKSKNNVPDSVRERGQAAKLKIIIRRLPPGLTQSEYEETLGDEWINGSAKVDWAMFKPGKISKDPAKPSRPSRAYIHLKNADDIPLVAQKVHSAAFVDAKHSSKDLSLLGPPVVEFAPYGRVPSGKIRKDARQGTIDQDPEFIDFLESLTNPITKAPTVDQDGEGTRGKEKITTTPLVQYLKEKKANKGKEGSQSGKNTKHNRSDSKDSKASTGSSSKKLSPQTTASTTTATSSSKKRGNQPSKVEQATKEIVSKANEQAAAMKGSSQKNSSTSTTKPTTPKVVPNSTANNALAEKKRERGNAAAAVKMLQRDLLGAGTRGGREGRGGRTKPDNARPAPVSSDGSSGGTPVSGQKKAALESSAETPSKTAEPKPAAVSNTTAPVSKARSQPVAPPPPPTKSTQAASTATQAFLKHANPSQGVTETLLEETFAKFGNVLKVEIDKKKGFAYIDFETPESLQKAVKSSPVKVAEGSVVILERKTGPNLQTRNARGGSTTPSRGGTPSNSRGSSGRGRGNGGRGGSSQTQNNKTKGGSSTSNTSNPAPTGSDSGSAVSTPAPAVVQATAAKGPT